MKALWLKKLTALGLFAAAVVPQAVVSCDPGGWISLAPAGGYYPAGYYSGGYYVEEVYYEDIYYVPETYCCGGFGFDFWYGGWP